MYYSYFYNQGYIYIPGMFHALVCSSVWMLLNVFEYSTFRYLICVLSLINSLFYFIYDSKYQWSIGNVQMLAHHILSIYLCVVSLLSNIYEIQDLCYVGYVLEISTIPLIAYQHEHKKSKEIIYLSYLSATTWKYLFGITFIIFRWIIFPYYFFTMNYIPYSHISPAVGPLWILNGYWLIYIIKKAF